MNHVDLPLPLKSLQELPDQHKSLKDYVDHQQNVLAKVREALFEAKFLMELHDRRNKSKRNPDVIAKGDMVFLSINEKYRTSAHIANCTKIAKAIYWSF